MKRFACFSLFVLAFGVAATGVAIAQKCSERLVKDGDQSTAGTPLEKKAADVYFFAPFLDKPITGSQEWKKASQDKMPMRKNQKSSTPKVEKVVVSPSGDMAYAYGSTDSSFDDETGKHHELTIAFLDVWRVVDGSCKLAARMVQPEK